VRVPVKSFPSRSTPTEEPSPSFHPAKSSTWRQKSCSVASGASRNRNRSMSLGIASGSLAAQVVAGAVVAVAKPTTTARTVKTSSSEDSSRGMCARSRTRCTGLSNSESMKASTNERPHDFSRHINARQQRKEE
jgi:hypothetical protein